MYWWIIGHNKEETSADVPPEQSFAPSIIRHNIEIGPSPQIELEIKMANAGQTDLVSPNCMIPILYFEMCHFWPLGYFRVHSEKNNCETKWSFYRSFMYLGHLFIACR